MSRAFDYCMKIVFAHEGGEVDDPRDPGGHTNMGITQATLNRARKTLQGLPASVSDLTRHDCTRIYEALYWRPVRGDELPLPLALLTFDACVNQGEGDAKRFLQQAVGVKVDGAIGPKTLAAAQRSGRPAIEELAARRMHDYMLLDKLDDTFGLGWSRRLCHVYGEALDAQGVAL